MSKIRICVLGAGVAGLGSALCIEEMLREELVLPREQYSIDVVADQFSPNLTSDAAAGIWEPYTDGVSKHSLDYVTSLSKPTWDWMKRLWRMSLAPDTGLQLIHGYLLTDPGASEPEWRHVVLNWHAMSADELSMFPGYKAGFGFTSFICQPSRYMDYLMKRLKASGVRFIQRHVQDVTELSSEYDIVVNCTGAGANQLLDDDHVIPIRGQIVRVKAPWLKIFAFDSTDSGAGFPKGYILPNPDFCVLGGSHDVGEWDLTPSKQVTERIIRTCSELIPGLEKAEILEERCGLRPGRFNLRLETEKIKTSTGRDLVVVHNYGHGGIGVTMHMGTGHKAAKLVRSAIQEMRPKSKL